MDLIFRFEQELERNSLAEPGDAILMAVSGGVDSCVLMELLSSLKTAMGFDLCVGHVDHGLRGGESDADERFVSGAAKKLSLPFYSTRLQGLKDSDNIQDAARAFRYGALIKMARAHGAKKIAFAHNRNDQAETVLLNLVRGAGLDGLSGMPVRRALDNGLLLIRPLLAFSREDISRYAAENNIEYRQDSTNLTTKYSRNLIRHNVIPELLKINQRAVDHLYETAAILRDDDELLDSLAEEALAKIAVGGENAASLVLHGDGYLEQPLPIRRRVVRQVFKRLTGGTKDLKTDHIFRIDQIASGSSRTGVYSLPQGVSFERRNDQLIFTRMSPITDGI